MATIDIPGTTIHYRESGSGPLALFVHGYPLDSTAWLDQLDALGDVRRCVAMDLRGFGQSAPIAVSPLTMEQHAVDMAHVIEGLGEERADIVGLSMGGYAAMAFAELHGEMVRSLALIDTKSQGDSEAGKAGRDVQAVKVVVQGLGRVAGDLIEALVAQNARPFVKARVRAMIEHTRHETVVAALEGMKVRPDRSEVLQGVTAPVAVIVGSEDKLMPPEEAHEMSSLMADSVLTVIQGAGHLSPIEEPAAVSAALRDLFSRVDGAVPAEA